MASCFACSSGLAKTVAPLPWNSTVRLSLILALESAMKKYRGYCFDAS